MLTILGPQDLRSCNFGSTQWIDPYSSHFLTHEMGKGNADFIHPLKISPRSPVSHFHDVSQSLIKAISLFDPEIRDGIHQLAKYCKMLMCSWYCFASCFAHRSLSIRAVELVLNLLKSLLGRDFLLKLLAEINAFHQPSWDLWMFPWKQWYHTLW